MIVDIVLLTLIAYLFYDNYKLRSFLQILNVSFSWINNELRKKDLIPKPTVESIREVTQNIEGE